MIPSFKSHLRVEYVDDDKVFLIGEQHTYLLRSRVCAMVARLIDGARSLDAIVAALDGQVTPPEVYYMIDQLTEAGHVEDRAALSEAPAAAFWLSQGVDPAAARAGLESAVVAVEVARGDAGDGRAMAAALERAGVQVAGADALRPALRVVLTDDYLAAEIAAVHERARAEGFAWLPVKPAGVTPWIGPVFRPGGPCWACLAPRLRHNRAVESYVCRRASVLAPLTPPLGHTEASVQAALHLGAVWLARWLAQGGRADSALLAIDLHHMRIEPHPVVKRPQCAACGDPAAGVHDARERPLVLTSRPVVSAEGGQRIESPRATYERLQRHISPITGVVASVTRRIRDREAMPLYSAVHPVCPAGRDPAFSEFARASWGKGSTAAQSRTSALCEAMERRMAIFRGDEPRARARMHELDAPAVAPERVLLFSERQYREREAINAEIASERRRVPVAFDPDWSIEWTPAWSLTHDALRYLPTALCYEAYELPEAQRFCYFNANGHAAGNCVEEAILQGFLELCERDAVAIWWYNRLARPQVALEGLGDGHILSSRAHYERLGWRMWVLDLTTDLGIPTMAALAMRGDHGGVFAGFGCHLSARLAVRRAVTELGQVFDPGREVSPAWRDIDIAREAYLLPAPGDPISVGEPGAAMHDQDVLSSVRACIERARACGLEVIALDQSRADVELSVVKVVAPGLRHFWPRLAPGRLTDVPVALGWRETPPGERELNQAPIFW